MKKILIIIGCILIIVIGLGVLTTKVFLNSNEKTPEDIGTVEETKENDSNKEASEVEKGIGIAIGNTAPGFTLENISGVEESLEDYRGKNIVLNFFRTT